MLKKIIGGLIASLVFGVGVVYAAPLSGDLDTLLSLVANAGALTFNTDNVVVPGTASNWNVNDARGHKPLAVPGWSLTVAATNFSDGAAEESVIDVTNLTVTPENLSVTSGNPTGVSLGSAHTFTGEADPTTVSTSSVGNGRGQAEGDLALSLVVPANSDAANYESTLTFTLQ
jgi:hypothetical protein